MKIGLFGPALSALQPFTHYNLYNESGEWLEFVDEVAAQHSMYLYLWLLGIPESVIHQLPFEDAPAWAPPTGPDLSQG